MILAMLMMHKNQNIKLIYSKIETFPNLYKLFYLAISISIFFTSCERLFLTMRRIINTKKMSNTIVAYTTCYESRLLILFGYF